MCCNNEKNLFFFFYTDLDNSGGPTTHLSEQKGHIDSTVCTSLFSEVIEVIFFFFSNLAPLITIVLYKVLYKDSRKAVESRW